MTKDEKIILANKITRLANEVANTPVGKRNHIDPKDIPCEVLVRTLREGID